MHNVLQILRRDFKRLVTVPAAWVIMIGLILIPPLYAWFNIYGFWNPYGNTDSIKVAVANMDEGTDNALLGKVNLGDQIEGTLKSNDQLGWEFMGKANAMEAVESGDCYAAIVIPSDFSEDLANVVTNSKHRPTLEYYVNEKASPDFAENHRPRRDRGRPHRQQHLRLHRQRRARQSRQLSQQHHQRQHQHHRQRNHRRTRQHQAERRHDPLRNRGSRHPS